MVLNRQAYETLIKEDIEWLLKQGRSLEREHIECVLANSADCIYPLNLKEDRDSWRRTCEKLATENIELEKQVKELEKKIYGHECVQEISGAIIKDLTAPEIKTSICADPKDLRG